MTADNLTKTGSPVAGSEQKNVKVSLEALAKLTGFPVEMIRDEIFKGHDEQEVSLDDLRRAMLTYIDSTMLMEESR